MAVDVESRDRPVVMGTDHANARMGGELPRVTLFTVGELFGGVERHILGLIDGLRRLGVHVTLALFHDRELAREARARGVTPRILPSQNRSIGRAAAELADHLREERIDIVHVHGYKATVTTALARLHRRFAVIKTEHGLPESYGSNAIAVLRTGFYHALDRWATRGLGAAVCYVTEGLRAHHQAYHRNLQRHVVPNGIDPLDRAAIVRPPELADGGFHVVVVGRVDDVKGQRYAVEAVGTGRTGDDCVLHVVGTGPSEPSLRALARERGVADRVRFHGFRRDVYGFIAHADVLLLPSLHEGLPYVLIEAMALGTPIVATRVGGLAEVLVDGRTARLVPARDPMALAEAMAEIRAQPAVARQRASEAEAMRRARFSLDAMALRYAELYRDARRRR